MRNFLNVSGLFLLMLIALVPLVADSPDTEHHDAGQNDGGMDASTDSGNRNPGTTDYRLVVNVVSPAGSAVIGREVEFQGTIAVYSGQTPIGFIKRDMEGLRFAAGGRRSVPAKPDSGVDDNVYMLIKEATITDTSFSSSTGVTIGLWTMKLYLFETDIYNLDNDGTVELFILCSDYGIYDDQNVPCSIEGLGDNTPLSLKLEYKSGH